jgi:hypothetical protein
MPAKLRDTYSLTESQAVGIDHIMKTCGVGASTANRMIFEHVAESCPDIAEILLLREIEEDERALTAKKERLRMVQELKESAPQSRLIIEKPGKTEVVPSTDWTPEFTIQNYVGSLGKDSATGRIAQQKIQRVLSAHPDKICLVPEQHRHLFRNGGGQ